jgi:hypothetical protein
LARAESANRELGKFPNEIEPLFAYRSYMRRRWAQMCPRCKHLQVFQLAFRNNLDLSARQIAYPSGKCKFFGLVVDGESKADALHSTADKQMQPRVLRYVWIRHCSSPREAPTRG